MKKRNIFSLSAFCFLLSALFGCGYTSRTIYRGPYKTIFVEPFANKVDLLSEGCHRPEAEIPDLSSAVRK